MKKRFTMMISIIIIIFSSVIFAQSPTITNQPRNQGVIEGQTASFLVQASGDSLSYQWYLNDTTLIVGATDSVYITPPTTLANNKSKFKCTVKNPSDSITTSNATLFVTAIGSRVTEGVQVLYDFKEAGGTSINDQSGVGTPYNLGLLNPAAVTWTPKGLGVNYFAYINNENPATKVINACKLTNETTLELWIKPAFETQTEGSRILVLSEDVSNSNFSIYQMDKYFILRTRTTTTGNRGEPGISTAIGTATDDLTHLLFTRASNGDAKVYKNGVEIVNDVISGNFSNWNSNYFLQLANELVDGPREWLGTFYLVSVYDRALSQAEVTANFNLGANVDSKPEIIIEPKDLGLVVGQPAVFSVNVVGADTLTYQWKKNGVNIPGAINPSYTIPSVSLSDNGNLYFCTVTNSSGSAVSRFARLTVTASDKRVTVGQALLYDFQEGVGDTVKDVSGFGTPLNLKINTPSFVEWKPYGLLVDSVANINSIDVATKLYDEAIATTEFTFEGWIKPENLTQLSAAIFSLSGNTSDRRNFKLNQQGNYLQSYLRTSTTSETGFDVSTSGGSLTNNIVHVVFTRNVKEQSQIFINGSRVANRFTLQGDLSNWRPDYTVKLANEVFTSEPWKGLINLISWYNRALDTEEIQQNYSLGPLGNINLNTPGNLSAQVNSPGAVQLTWSDSSNNEDGFILERKQAGFSYVQIATLLANSNAYIDSNVVDTTTYTYRIKSFNYLTQSSYSNESSATTLLSTLNAPTNLIAALNPSDIRFVKLTWEDNSTNELGFIIERKDGDANSANPYEVIDSLSANLITYIDSSVNEFSIYTYRLKAFNLFTQSSYSNVSTVFTPLLSIASPSNLLATPNPADTSNVLLSWNDNSTNELGFVIERKTGDTSSVEPFILIDTVAAGITSYEDTTVVDSTTYTYRVYAFNNDTVSNYSNLAEVTTPVPVELTSFIATAANGQVLLEWETATELNNAGFSIQRSKGDGKFTDLDFVRGKGTTTNKSTYRFTDKSALSGKYFYRLEQVDLDGSVNYSKIVEVDLGLPKNFALEQNYPNPFNPSTTIRFALPTYARVTIKLYNALGQQVTNIINSELDAGIHETTFNASQLSSGVYFYMLEAQGANGSNFTATKRLILMK